MLRLVPAAGRFVRRVGFLSPGSPESILVERLRGDLAWLPANNIEIVSLLQKRLRALNDDRGRNRWLHHRWMSIFDDMCDHLEGQFDFKPGFSFLLVGAGIRNPLSFPLLVFLAGAGKLYVVEPQPIREEPRWMITWGLQEMVIRLLSRDVTSRHFRRKPEDLSEILDLQALFLDKPISEILNPEKFVLLQSTLEEVDIPRSSIDLVSSRSVMQYFHNYEACINKFGDIVRQSGIMYHDVDLSSHRNDDVFKFYYDANAAGQLNLLRLSDHLRLLEENGFRSYAHKRFQENEYELDRNKILDRFKNYSNEDLLCRRAVIISVRKDD